MGSPAVDVSKNASGTRVARGRQVTDGDVPPHAVSIESDVVSDFEGAGDIVDVCDSRFIGDGHVINVGQCFQGST